MKVIKRDGRIEDFDIRKIKLTLSNASDEMGQPFTEGDVNNIAKAIENKIGKNYNEEVKVKEILHIVLEELESFGFPKVAHHYKEYTGNFYR